MKAQDITEAIATLETMKHWTLKTINRRGARSGYHCTVWGNGKRVNAQGATPLHAANAAIAKLNPPPKFKVFK